MIPEEIEADITANFQENLAQRVAERRAIARHGRRGRHLVLYRLSDQGTINFVRILHHSMDIGRHVPDDLAPGAL